VSMSWPGLWRSVERETAEGVPLIDRKIDLISLFE
jgi:hypothetical protein